MHIFVHIETDLIPGLGAFFACLALPLEIGILTGIAINMAFILSITLLAQRSPSNVSPHPTALTIL